MANQPPTKFSLSLSSKPNTNLKFSIAKSAQNGASTSRRGPLSDDAEHDDACPQTTTITTFDGVRRAPAQRVIAPLPNRDWREKRRYQKSELPANSSTTSAPSGPEQEDKPALAFGLTVAQPKTTTNDDEDAMEVEPAAAPAPLPQSADDEAIAALLDSAPISHRTIEREPIDDTQALRADLRSAPRAATLEEYDATPVEGYGAAILRGYLRPGETLESRMEKFNKGAPGNKAKASKEQKRPALLGIGAKAVEGTELADINAWGTGKRRGPPVEFTPLVRRNKVTGEIVTEEQFKELTQEGAGREEREKGGREENGKRNGEQNGKRSREENGRRDRDDGDSTRREGTDRRRDERSDKSRRERDRYSRTGASSRRDRSASPEHRSHRSRAHDDNDSEDTRRRYKDRERRRDRDDRHRDVDRRYRERSRDRDRDRR